MKKIIKNNKKLILGIFIGIIVSSISVYAATTYLASDITYTTSKNSSIKNVKGALDDLYSKGSSKKSGDLFVELFLNNRMMMNHNNSKGYSGNFYIDNLDFSNIKSITFNFDISTNNIAAQEYAFYENGEQFFLCTTSGTHTVNINGKNNVKFRYETSYDGDTSLGIVSYVTIDGVEHKK